MRAHDAQWTVRSRSLAAGVRALLVAGVLALPIDAQVRVGEFQTEQPSFAEGFGKVLAADGDVLAVGTWRHAGIDVYTRSAGAWTFTQELEPPVPNKHVELWFGASVAVDGDWIAVGMPGYEHGGLVNAGAVFLFRRTGGTWHLKQTLIAAPPKHLARFGSKLSMQDGLLAVTAPFAEVAAPSIGEVHLFDHDGGVWTSSGTLWTLVTDSAFGSSVCVDRGRVLVGAMWAYPKSFAALYERKDGTWKQTASVKSSEFFSHLFGGSVALDGDRMVVAAWGGQPISADLGVYVYAKVGSAWPLEQRIVPDGLQPISWGMLALQFGREVRLVGRDLLIGAEGSGDLGDGSGAVYHFRWSAGLQEPWTQLGKLVPPDASAHDQSGFTFAQAGDHVLLSAPGFHAGVPGDWYAMEGRIVEFELGFDAQQYCHCTQPAPCGNRDDYGGCTNSEGLGAGLWAGGTASVQADELLLDAHWAIPLQSVVLLMGPATQASPFGDGRLCVGPGDLGLLRFPVQVADDAGSTRWGPGLVAASQTQFPAWGHIHPGDTWHFQAWYRDPESLCGSDANLTNAVKVDFKP